MFPWDNEQQEQPSRKNLSTPQSYNPVNGVEYTQAQQPEPVQRATPQRNQVAQSPFATDADSQQVETYRSARGGVNRANQGPSPFATDIAGGSDTWRTTNDRGFARPEQPPQYDYVRDPHPASDYPPYQPQQSYQPPAQHQPATPSRHQPATPSRAPFAMDDDDPVATPNSRRYPGQGGHDALNVFNQGSDNRESYNRDTDRNAYGYGATSAAQNYEQALPSARSAVGGMPGSRDSDISGRPSKGRGSFAPNAQAVAPFASHDGYDNARDNGAAKPGHTNSDYSSMEDLPAAGKHPSDSDAVDMRYYTPRTASRMSELSRRESLKDGLLPTDDCDHDSPRGRAHIAPPMSPDRRSDSRKKLVHEPSPRDPARGKKHFYGANSQIELR